MKRTSVADLRRALVRTLVCASLAAGATLLTTGRGAAAAVVVALAAAIGPLTFVERQGPRRWPALSPGALVWLASLVVLPLAWLQAVWVDAALQLGFEGALAALQGLVQRALRDPLDALEALLGVGLAAGFAAVPFALAAQARARPESYTAVLVVVLLLSLPVCCASGAAFLGLLIGWHLLLGVYLLGDVIDARLGAQRASPDDAAALAAAIERGQVSWSKLWLLAYCGHGPARAALAEPPAMPEELSAWCRGLELAGREAVVRAAVAVGERVLGTLDSGSGCDPERVTAAGRALSFMDAWVSAEPALRDELRAQARAALAAVPPEAEPPALRGTLLPTLRAVVDALEGEGAWAGAAAARALARAADLGSIAIGGDDETVRGAITDALATWALSRPVEPPASASGSGGGGVGDV